MNDGVEGIWNDMNEIADMSTDTKTVPETVQHQLDDGRYVTQKEVHNLYGHYQTKATYEGMRKIEPNVRPFVLTRAASAGTQRYSTLWTGDNTSIWEHLEMSIPMLLNLGMSGYAHIGADIGGFIGDGDAELLERWMQLGAFYPLCRNHSCMNSTMQEPWSFGGETEGIVVKAIHYRYGLVSHLYQLFWEHYNTGAPIMRPLFYHYQEDLRTYHINDEFLFGDSILVAPIVRPHTYERLVYLPEGSWCHETSNVWYQGGQSYIIQVPRDEIPVFIRGGSMRLVNPKQQFIDVDYEKEIELHIYHDGNQQKTFYFDDGISFDYEKQKVSEIEVTVIDDHVKINKIAMAYKVPNIRIVEHWSTID
jgi:alpha-glucosidase